MLSVYVRYHEGILLPKKNNSEVLVPLLTLLDNLLVVGAVREQEDLSRLLILLEPKTFGPKGSKECTTYCMCTYVYTVHVRIGLYREGMRKTVWDRGRDGVGGGGKERMQCT